MDPTSFSGLLQLISNNGYLLILILIIIEGPIATAAASFAASLGLFNIYIIFLMSFLKIIVFDFVYFFIGKIGRMAVINAYLKRFNFGKRTIKHLEIILKKHPGKALTIIKLVPPLPTPGLILAGVVNMPLAKFTFFCTIIGFFYALFFTLFGYFLGATFDHITKYSKYLNLAITATLIFGLILFWLYKKLSKKLFEKVGKKI